MVLPPDPIRVSHDIPKKQVTFKLQGLVLIALEDMARDRRESITQVLKDIIEQRLVKDQYLPGWWFENKL
jgi:hypothetical protein